MTRQIQKIELLAPAKDKNIAIDAINSGADAIYIGYSRFGARSAAGNSIDDIKEVIEYAHIFNAKVYITLNTIFDDNEITKVISVINKLYEAKADGIIIQDMGILEYDIPPIPLIASTQCHNNTLEKVQFLEDTGFKRVILPREFSLEEIKNISDNTNIELETFIHGALCVSYSGQCYLSHAIGGRSANRGECAQPCRKKYSLKDKNGNYICKDKYLLSLKDFNLSKHLEKLILAGVTSFKIEGRLKDNLYVRNTVSFYRQKIDEIIEKMNLQKSSYGCSTTDFQPDLEKTFNRGYTDYFLTNRTKEISALNYSKSLGKLIGTVQETSQSYFIIKNNILNNADGICFLNEKDELTGTNIIKTEGNKVYPNSMVEISIGTKIYRNMDKKFNETLQNSDIKRKINVDINIEENDSGYIFKITDINGVCAKIEINNTFEHAKNKTASLKNLEKQLSKLGETEFCADKINIDIKNIPFIAVSQINEIRRELVKKLQTKCKNSYKQEKRTNTISLVQYPYKKLTYNSNILNKDTLNFYKKRGVEEIEPALETQNNYKNKTVMTTKHCLKYLFDLCPKQNKNTKFEEPFYLTDEYNKNYELKFNCQNCQMEIMF